MDTIIKTYGCEIRGDADSVADFRADEMPLIGGLHTPESYDEKSVARDRIADILSCLPEDIEELPKSSLDLFDHDLFNYYDFKGLTLMALSTDLVKDATICSRIKGVIVSHRSGDKQENEHIVIPVGDTCGSHSIHRFYIEISDADKFTDKTSSYEMEQFYTTFYKLVEEAQKNLNASYEEAVSLVAHIKWQDLMYDEMTDYPFSSESNMYDTDYHTLFRVMKSPLTFQQAHDLQLNPERFKALATEYLAQDDARNIPIDYIKRIYGLANYW